MNNDQKRIILEQILTSGQRRTSAQGDSPISATSRWGFYLILIPALALMAVLGMFFFAAFVALFVIVAAGLGIRFWWMRRKIQRSNPSSHSTSTQSDQHESVDIEDAQIIDEIKVETKTTHKP